MAVGLFVLAGCATSTPEPTATPIPPTPTPEHVGDVELGREIHETGGGIIGKTSGRDCSACHSLDGSVRSGGEAGPSFQGISERAGDRVPELSAVEYLRQSIMDPSAYVVEGFDPNIMPKSFRLFFSEEDIDALIAFMLTQ